MASIQYPFDFHLPSTNAVSFVPVDLCATYPSALKANLRYSFEFAPPAGSILFADSHYIMDSSSHGDGLNFLYFPNYIQIHELLHPKIMNYYMPNAKGGAAGTHPDNQAELFTLASTRLLDTIIFPTPPAFYASRDSLRDHTTALETMEVFK
jgi:hypothetical protein